MGSRAETQETGGVGVNGGGGTCLLSIRPAPSNGFLLPLHGEDGNGNGRWLSGGCWEHQKPPPTIVMTVKYAWEWGVYARTLGQFYVAAV